MCILLISATSELYIMVKIDKILKVGLIITTNV